MKQQTDKLMVIPLDAPRSPPLFFFDYIRMTSTYSVLRV